MRILVVQECGRSGPRRKRRRIRRKSGPGSEMTRDKLPTADRVGLVNYSILNVCSAGSPSSFMNGCGPPARSSTAHSFVPDLGKGLSATLIS